MNELIITKTDVIQKIIHEGNGEIVNEKYCSDFNKYISENYPWTPISFSKIDWPKTKIDYKRFSWTNADDKETEEFLKGTCINKFEKFCIVYGKNEPGLLVDRRFAYRNLPILTIFGWTVRFIVGAKRNSYGIIELDYTCFIEVDFGDWLTASK